MNIIYHAGCTSDEKFNYTEENTIYYLVIIHMLSHSIFISRNDVYNLYLTFNN